MPNYEEILRALANLPLGYNASPLTPTFSGSPVPLPSGIPNVPYAPAPMATGPEYGGPSMVTEPPQAPLDTSIIQQMLALRGPAPIAPAPKSKAERIFNALAGFGAGFQGNGAQFLAQLQEPQREYQRQLQNYNNLGTELGTRGLEIAQRRQEQKTRRAQEVSDREFAAEVDREARRLKLTDERERALFENALLSRRQREDDERAAAENRRKEQALQERDARLIARDYGKLTDNPKIALELGRYYAGLTDKLSPEAAKFESVQNRLAEARALRLARIQAGGGTTAGGKLMAVLENGQTVPASLVDKSKGIVPIGGKPVKVVGYTGGGISSQPQAKAGGAKNNDPLGIR